MNGFEQIKSFYTWVFNNPDKVRPTHISLYLFLLNQNNRSMWVEWFKCPYDLAMQGACIGNKNTYYKCLEELQFYKLIEYKKGINNYKAPLIKLIQLYDTEPLTEQVSVPQSEPQSEPLSVLLNKNIYKLITDNFKTINSNNNKFCLFISELEKNNKPINNLETRTQIFKDECKTFIPTYGTELVKSFFLYWSEPNKTKTKMKYELQQTWDLSRRLSTWSKNESNFKKPDVKPKSNLGI